MKDIDRIHDDARASLLLEDGAPIDHYLYLGSSMAHPFETRILSI